MSAYDKAGVPFSPGVGNHDRDAPPGADRRATPPRPEPPPATTARCSRSRPLSDGRRRAVRRPDDLPARSARRRPRGRGEPLLRGLRQRPLDLYRQLVLADHGLRPLPAAFGADRVGRGAVRLPPAGRTGGHGRGQGRIRRHAHADRGPGRPELSRHHREDAHDGQGRVAGQREVRGDRRRRPGSTASSSRTSRASSSTAARATCRTTSTAARAASFTPRAPRHRPRLLARLPADPGGRRPDRHGHRADLRQGRNPDRGAGQRPRAATTSSSRLSASSRSSTTPPRSRRSSCAIPTRRRSRARSEARCGCTGAGSCRRSRSSSCSGSPPA